MQHLSDFFIVRKHSILMTMNAKKSRQRNIADFLSKKSFMLELASMLVIFEEKSTDEVHPVVSWAALIMYMSLCL
jgi:hypothetical protein